MQSFLPYADFEESARVLDRLRLCKQRLEALQILKALADPGYGWQNHPAVKMWRGYEWGLVTYGLAVCKEWTQRGYADGCAEQIEELLWHWDESEWEPWWLGDERLHLSHRSNLVRKDAGHYGKLWPGVPSNLEYWWPTK